MKFTRVFYAAFFLLLASCGQHDDAKSNSEIVNSDEVHLPEDWSASINVELAKVSNDFETTTSLISSESSSEIEPLINQLWKLAFSGDAQVYAPDYLGMMDANTPIEPREMVEFLTEYDTTAVENLETGILENKVTKMEFTESTVSALVLYTTLSESESGSMTFTTNNVGVGHQVFDVDGVFRGVKNTYYIDMNSSKLDEEKSTQIITFGSDSLGIFRLMSFDCVQQDDCAHFDELVFDNQGSVTNFTIDFQFNFREQSLIGAVADEIKPEA